MVKVVIVPDEHKLTRHIKNFCLAGENIMKELKRTKPITYWGWKIAVWVIGIAIFYFSILAAVK